MNRKDRRRLAKTNVRNNLALLAQAFRHHQQRQFATAERLYRQILDREPENVEATRLLGEVLVDRNQAALAITILQRLALRQPEWPAAHMSLGNAYRLTGIVDAAIASYRAAIGLAPNFAEAHHGLGLTLLRAQRELEAVASFRLAVQAKPGWAVAWKDLGLALAVLGDLADAEAAFQRTVAIQPELGEAQRHLAAIRKDEVSAAQRAAILANLSDPRLPPDEKIELLFALGRQDDKAGRFDDAFFRFSSANSLLRAQQEKAGVSFDRARLIRDIDRLIATFTPEVFAGLTAGGMITEAPVFIVGMPRTGSTLLEQIAASHSNVFGAGEYSGIGAIAGRLGWTPSPAWALERLKAEAELYLRGLPTGVGRPLRIIDKMPDNIFSLGLISAVFPRARVIFCARDRRDTVISCFFQRFAQPLGYDTDMQDCAFRLAEIERLTAHWQKVLKLPHMTISYEALLSDPETQARALIDFVGLRWEPQCLDFHQSQRAVRTASWAQVRQPLYLSSVGRWRHYEKHLKDL